MATSQSTSELAQLMRSAKSGDQVAFSALYEAYYLPVFRYCQKRLRNLHDAEDITQQVFLRLYNSRSEFFDQNLSPLNYLYVIARHCLADFWKSKNRAPVNLPEDFDAPNLNNAQETAMSQITAEQVLNIVTAEEKQILTLRLIEGYSSREVAVKINKSEEAVRQIQCRALKKIKEQIIL